MNKRILTLTSLVVPIFSALALSGCTAVNKKIEGTDDQNTNSASSGVITQQTNSSNISGDTIPAINQPYDFTQLKISSGCIGCGRCVRTDPEHFILDQNDRKVAVTTQENLNSPSLQYAIMNCPARAIIRS
ncbi:MAG: ferredoxin [Patescibacteria group bacterium]